MITLNLGRDHPARLKETRRVALTEGSPSQSRSRSDSPCACMDDDDFDVFSEDVLHAVLHSAQDTAELPPLYSSPQLESNQHLQSSTESTVSHAARQEANEDQQMVTSDPARQQECRQERQRRLSRASQARHRKKRTVSSLMYSLAGCDGLVNAVRLASQRAQKCHRDSGVQNKDAEQPRLAYLSNVANLMQRLMQLLCHGPRESAKACRGRSLSCRSSWRQPWL